MRYGIRETDDNLFNFILAPMIDIVLFLLIFFMIAYAKPVGFQNINLPKSNSSQPHSLDQVTILEMTQNGQLSWNGKIYKSSDFAAMIQDGLNVNQPVVFKADKSLSYQDIIGALDSLKQTGVKQIFLATY